MFCILCWRALSWGNWWLHWSLFEFIITPSLCWFRKGHEILRQVLPKKYEHVLLLRMTSVQQFLYHHVTKLLQQKHGKVNPINPIKAYSVYSKVSCLFCLLFSCCGHVISVSIACLWCDCVCFCTCPNMLVYLYFNSIGLWSAWSNSWASNDTFL